MAQDYTVEQLNHGRRVYDFMRWDNVAFTISALLLIASVAIIGVKGFNWGLDFTGGTVIEVNFSQPADLDKIRDTVSLAGFKDPLIQNFGSSRGLMVRLAPVITSVCRRQKAWLVRNWVKLSSMLLTKILMKMQWSSVLNSSDRVWVRSWLRPGRWH